MMRIVFFIFFIHIFAICGACSQIVGESPQTLADKFLPEGDNVRVEVWVQNLRIPWSLVFLPDGRALVSERPGTIRTIRNGMLLERPYAKIGVEHIGEGGLMGLALHPLFPEKPYIYIIYTYRAKKELRNRVVRLKDNGKEGVFDKVIIDNIPGGTSHNGGRIAFGPDGMLYITTGDTFDAELAQTLTSLGGKILRITPDGEIPADNPFKGSPIYSYGHRNPQGIAWQPGSETFFESEHGPSGEFAHFANDEINIIVKGGNYGWPKVIGAPGIKPYRDPCIVWKKATPPSGMCFYVGDIFSRFHGDLFVATLRSEALIRIKLGPENKVAKIERWFAKDFDNGKYGRIRDVIAGPDGALYFLTSNTDGRGSPRSHDDKIYRIVPKI